MKNSSLFQVFEKLNKKDLRDLRKWLASPVHNLREDVAALFSHLVEPSEKPSGEWTKTQIYSKIYPGQPFDEVKMNHLMSWLLGQILDFLAWREWQNETGGRGLLLCRALRKLDLPELFEKEYAKTKSALESQPLRDAHFHDQSHLLLREKYEQSAKQNRSADLPFDELETHFSMSYRLNRLRFECSAAVFQTVGSLSRTGFGRARKSVAEPILQASPAVEIYEKLLAALRDAENETAFFEAKNLLSQNIGLFSENEARDLYLLALNFCIRKINVGKKNFMREAFDLYRDGLENRALFENGSLSIFTYKNAVTAALWLRELDWARDFIENYRQFLPPRERHAAWLYNLAVYFFRLPDFDRALELLRDADFSDVLTQLDARSMLLRIYFEKNYADALESLLDSFQVFLQRHREIGYQRDSYLNLIKFTRQMLRGEADFEKLKSEVENTASLAERGWILEQLKTRGK